MRLDGQDHHVLLAELGWIGRRPGGRGHAPASRFRLPAMGTQRRERRPPGQRADVNSGGGQLGPDEPADGAGPQNADPHSDPPARQMQLSRPRPPCGARHCRVCPARAPAVRPTAPFRPGSPSRQRPCRADQQAGPGPDPAVTRCGRRDPLPVPRPGRCASSLRPPASPRTWPYRRGRAGSGGHGSQRTPRYRCSG